MTNQETFDTIVKHLKKQGKKSLSKLTYVEDRCMYRTEEGLKCAAGCLIPDDLYDESFEDYTVDNSFASTVIKSLGHNLDLVKKAQNIHDLINVEEWPFEFSKLAIAYNLNAKECRDWVVRRD